MCYDSCAIVMTITLFGHPGGTHHNNAATQAGGWKIQRPTHPRRRAFTAGCGGADIQRLKAPDMNLSLS